MNLWHGLTPSSLLLFEKLEPEARRRIREKMQVRLISDLDPDIAFFQEVNPITTRFHELCTELGRLGLSQPDLVGVKLLGFGLPVHLFSGLAILAKSEWPLKLVSAVRLSGQNSVVNRFVSFQLKEERFALFIETTWPGIGKVLLVNTHLHHGLEATEPFEKKLAQVMEELNLSSSLRSEIRERLFAANERRTGEMRTLLRFLERIQSKYQMVVIGGDFNCEPEGEIGQQLRELGFSDAWRMDHPADPGFTFDRTKNPANHIFQDRFPITFMVEDLSFDSDTKSRLEKLAIEQERRPRRIDQLWIRSPLLKSVRTELVGQPDAQGMAPSDHFGLLADVDVE